MSAAWALLSVTQSHEGTAYQHAVLTPEMRPGELVRRIALQYAYHLGPVVLSPVGELARLAVGTAVGAFAIAFLLVGSASAEFEGDSPPFVRHAATGLVFAGLGYSVILLGTAAPTAFRLEFLSGPGIGLALASAVVAVATQVPKPMRQFVALALAGWIVAVGTGRTVAMQETWDTGSSYPQQMSMLRGLAARVPDLHPGTVILVLDEGRAWRSTFGFYHAVRYLYQGRAVGCVWGAWNALYPASLGPKGLDVEPWPAIRVPWGTPPRTYGYDEIVVVRSTPALTEIVRDWPASLPALPEGAHYDPMSRIAFSSDPIPEQGILR
jgi:hypothetical protein